MICINRDHSKRCFIQSGIVIALLFFVILLNQQVVVAGSDKPCIFETTTLVPTNYTNVSSLTNSTVTSGPKLLGHSVIDGNLWGLEEFRNQYTGHLEVYSDEKGYVKFKSNLNLTSIPLRSWNVIAYPEIYYGLKPWTPEIKPHTSHYLKLPARIPDLPTTYALVDYTIIESTTSYNVAFDIWLLRSQYARIPGNGDVEVMIWLHRGGNGSPPNPAGRRVGSLRTHILLDGDLDEAIFDVWIQENIGLGWTYIAFVLNHSKPRAEIGVDITFFLNKAIEYLGLRREDLYVFSIELGFELFYNSIVDFHASIYRYDLISSNISSPSIMRGLSERSKRLITWITPWGYLVDVDKFNEEFTPGIIVAYDIECELCTKTLREWFNRSLRYIMEFKASGKPLFINIFPEKYYPEWEWRGKLETFALSNYVLSELKKILGDGERSYIGFSELTGCLNSDICLADLINGYRVIRAFFPAARLFYYGSGGDRVESIVMLQKEAELDIVGIDLWSFDYKSNKLYIHSSLVSKIRILANSLPQIDLMIGELGFRLNDREAYIEPWDWTRPIIYEKGAHLRFFKDIFEHLGEVGIYVSHLGIWSWNDGVYSISDDLDTQLVIVDYAKKLGLIPKDLCIDEHYEDSEYDMKKIMLYILIMLLVFLATALLSILVYTGAKTA